jgi:hypothetical protein
MYNIAGFLQKFLKFEKDNNTKISLILETIKKETGLELTKENLEIKENTLKLNCSPIFRNEIFMRLPQITSALNSQKIFLKIV